MNKNTYIFICLMTLMMQSCIKDDLSNCFKERYLWFKSINPKYDYKNIVQQVNLYLYDEQKQFVREIIYTKEDLQLSGAKVYLPDQLNGTYTFVATINLSDTYQVFDTARLVTWKTSLHTGAENNNISFRLPDLYHSMQTFSLNINDTQLSDTMYLTKNINHIYITIESTAQDILDKIQPYIYGSNSMYNYENRLVGDRMISYHPHQTKKQPGKTEYSITTMLLRIGGDASLYLKEQKPDGTYADRGLFNITEKLAKIKNENGVKLYDTNQKLAGEDEYHFNLLLDDSSQIIDLRINDWYVIKNYIVIK